MTTSIDFLVRRSDLKETKLASTPLAPLAEGQALLAIDRFAFTANNVTYGAFGDAMSYWTFFPAPPGLEDFGRIPVWGFADVTESKASGVNVGERVYGYFPMSTHLVVEPTKVAAHGFVDGVAHRRTMHAVYNQYLRTAADPGYDRAREGAQALLRPLFTTSFFLDDLLAAENFFGANSIVLSSASSKTALGLGFLLRRRGGVNVVGLTSHKNVGFALGTGSYDRVLAYDALDGLPNDEPIAFVDMAGNGDVRANVHERWGTKLRASLAVGATHWNQMKSPKALPGPRPTPFFVPDRIKERAREWGPGGIEARVGQAWAQFLPAAERWMKITEGRGPAEVERVYRAMLGGSSDPECGHMLAMRG